MIPVWNRSTRQGVAVAAWFALNPVVFPQPRDDSAFATRAILGEEMWLAERRVSRALAIDGIAGAALLVAVDGARRRRRRQMTIATLGAMSALLWFWREMARLYDARSSSAAVRPSQPDRLLTTRRSRRAQATADRSAVRR
jgi:hypothetical protein